MSSHLRFCYCERSTAISLPPHEIASADFVSLAKTGGEKNRIDPVVLCSNREGRDSFTPRTETTPLQAEMNSATTPLTVGAGLVPAQNGAAGKKER